MKKGEKTVVLADIKVLVTGILSWILISFASLKLSIIYSPNPTLAYLVTYNILGVIYLLYFNAYLKSRFSYKTFIILFVLFNAGIHVFEFIYNKIVLIHSVEINEARVYVSVLSNLVVLTLTYLILRKVLKPYKS